MSIGCLADSNVLVQFEKPHCCFVFQILIASCCWWRKSIRIVQFVTGTALAVLQVTLRGHILALVSKR